MNFIKANDYLNYDNEPFVLIDVSGSTNSTCNITNIEQTVLNAECDIAERILNDKNIPTCTIMLWSGRKSVLNCTNCT